MNTVPICWVTLPKRSPLSNERLGWGKFQYDCDQASKCLGALKSSTHLWQALRVTIAGGRRRLSWTTCAVEPPHFLAAASAGGSSTRARPRHRARREWKLGRSCTECRQKQAAGKLHGNTDARLWCSPGRRASTIMSRVIVVRH